MPLNEESSMATQDSKTYVRRRKHKRAEQDVEIPHFQGRWAEGHSLKREEKEDLASEDEAAKRLINLELDVAEALAEFWRMAREPSQQGNFDAHLRWPCKRIRSSRFKKDSIAPCKPKEEPEDAISSAKNRSSCISERDSMFSDRDEIESTRMSKEYSQSDSRAESPSSPLPSLQLPCGAFLPRGSPTAKSAFQRVLPLVSLQRPCLLPVKSEIEDMQLEGFDVRARNSSVQRKSKSPKSAMLKDTLQKVSSGEQTVDFRDWKGAASSEVSRAKSELCPVLDLIVLNKPKRALTEKEKEARRLLRIQANRESARQTIRRKQVVCEELMKKASSLAFENEGMKQKRESLMQKLFCLKGQNYHLKQQLEMEASGNLGLLSAELPLKTLSESVSVPAFQLPSLPYALFPAHSFTWAMSATQAAAPNQAHTLDNKVKTLDAIHTDLVFQRQAAALAFLPAMPPSKEASVLRFVEQSPSHAFNGVCSPASMGRSSQKETGCTKLEHTEICTPQSEGAPCDLSSTTAVANRGLTDDLPEESVCMQANYSLCQPSSLTSCSSQAGLITMPAIALAHGSMEGYKHSQITQGVRGGATYDGSRSGYFLNGHSQINGFRGRNHLAVIAAAEARKRRKELTRQKFSHSRAHRLAILADNTKEN